MNLNLPHSLTPALSPSRLLGILATIIIVACGRPRAPGEVTADLPAEIAVQVENLNSSSITIHLEAGGISRRLGQMNTQETKSFVIPWKQLAGGTDFRLRGEVIGSDQRVFTGIMRVQPGQVVRWTLTPNLNMSSVTVF